MLPRFAEVVGRYAGNDTRTTLSVEIKELLIGPDIGAVRRNKDRHVADDFNTAGIGVFLECRPLAEETPLTELPEIAFVGQFFCGLTQCFGFALREIDRPVLPNLVFATVVIVQCSEQRVVIKPELRIRTECLVRFMSVDSRVGEKALGRDAQSGHAEALYGREVDTIFIEEGIRCDVDVGQPAGIAQLYEINQQFVASKSRRAHVG